MSRKHLDPLESDMSLPLFSPRLRELSSASDPHTSVKAGRRADSHRARRAGRDEPVAARARGQAMKRQKLPLHPGQSFRSPARASAKWHRVLACRRRKDGTVYVAIRRARTWKALGLPRVQRVEFFLIDSIGYETKP